MIRTLGRVGVERERVQGEYRAIEVKAVVRRPFEVEMWEGGKPSRW